MIHRFDISIIRSVYILLDLTFRNFNFTIYFYFKVCFIDRLCWRRVGACMHSWEIRQQVSDDMKNSKVNRCSYLRMATHCPWIKGKHRRKERRRSLYWLWRFQQEKLTLIFNYQDCCHRIDECGNGEKGFYIRFVDYYRFEILSMWKNF